MLMVRANGKRPGMDYGSHAPRLSRKQMLLARQSHKTVRSISFSCGKYGLS